MYKPLRQTYTIQSQLKISLVCEDKFNLESYKSG